MKSFKCLSATVLTLMCLTAVANAADNSRDASAPKESAGEYVSDSWITAKVKASLAEDELVKVAEVNVETFKGVVQLSGFVSSDAAMSQAIKITQATKGVRSVKNNMRLK